MPTCSGPQLQQPPSDEQHATISKGDYTAQPHSNNPQQDQLKSFTMTPSSLLWMPMRCLSYEDKNSKNPVELPYQWNQQFTTRPYKRSPSANQLVTSNFMSTETSSWEEGAYNTLSLSKHSRSSLTPLTETFLNFCFILALWFMQVWEESERASRTKQLMTHSYNKHTCTVLIQSY
jgi:hypothetical protein